MNTTPHQSFVPGLALAPQAVGTSGADGATIVRPWEIGRYISFILIGGALVAADAITFNVQARRQGTSTWDELNESDGSTDLEFTLAKTSDGGALEGGYVLGTIDLSRLQPADSQYEYDAVRLVADNANDTTPGIVGAAFLISGVRDLPAKDINGNRIEDDLLYKQLPFNDPEA